MSWSYSGDPSASSLDRIRFLIGDTDTTDQLLTNEEINAIYAYEGSDVFQTAIASAMSLAARFSRKADKSMGDISISYSQISKGFRDLVQLLRTQQGSAALAPYAGGISVSDKGAQEADSDRVAPHFRVGMHDYATPVSETTE